MHALVINLDKDTRRLTHMAGQLNNSCFQWERIPATDQATVAALRHKSEWRFFSGRCSDSEIACAISHSTAWGRALEKDLPFALILEDDVIFSNDAFGTLQAIWPILNNIEFDVIKIETFLGGIKVSRKNLPIGAKHRLCTLHGNHAGSAAYILSNNACKRLVDLVPHFSRAMDLELFDRNDSYLRILQLEPAIAVQDGVLHGRNGEFPSNIDGSRAEQDNSFAIVNRMKDPFRKISRAFRSVLLYPKRMRIISSTFSDPGPYRKSNMPRGDLYR
jgi:glycosyl transferase family 25